MINILIFSKDRACQLDLLIRSIKQLWTGWEQFIFNILWTFSGMSFKDAYSEVMKDHPEMNYIQQSDSFKNDVISLVSKDEPYTMFFVDDQVFKEPFELDCPEFKEMLSNEDIMTLSLRLYPGITYCYPRALPSSPPVFIKNYMWKWRDMTGDWSYPTSVDGHVFRTEDLIMVLHNQGYNHPNNFEDALVQVMIRRPFMTCFEKSKVVNNPCNKVGRYGNRHGMITADYLNTMYLAGKRIDLKPILGIMPVSCHQEFSYQWQ